MKKIGLIFFIFSLVFVVHTPSVSAVFNLYVGEQPITLDTPLMVVNGSILVPIEISARYFGGEITTNGDNVKVEFADRVMQLVVGDPVVNVNGTKRTLDVAPERSGDTVMIPLRFLADVLGMRLVFEDSSLSLRLLLPEHMKELGKVLPAEEEEYNSLKEIRFLGGSRSRVFIDVEDYTSYQSTLLRSPDRLVLDLTGVDGEALPTIEVEDPLVRQIRSDWFNETTLRIVVDLNRSTGYEIHRWLSGGLEIEFNYQLTDIGFERDDEFPRLWFKSSAKPDINVIHLEEPKRLVLDFQQTSLMNGAQEFDVDDPSVRRLRVSQFMPAISRVVFELEQDLTPLAVEANEDEDRYYVVFYDGIPDDQVLARFRQEPEPVEEEDIEKEIEKIPDVDVSSVDPTQVLAGKVIVVDPGHGGSDPGAIGPTGVFEKDVVLDISLFLGEMLQEAGAKVVFTRDSDVYVSIFERASMAQEYDADVLVSVHANAYLERMARGTETLFHPDSPESLQLAGAIQKELVDTLQLIDRGLRPRRDLAVLNHSTVPTALVEVAFVNNPEEEILLTTPGFQEASAKGIYLGIVHYFKGLAGE